MGGFWYALQYSPVLMMMMTMMMAGEENRTGLGDLSSHDFGFVVSCSLTINMCARSAHSVMSLR